MRSARRARAAGLSLAVALLAGCGGVRPAPPGPHHPNGLALWRIVHDLCVPDQAARGRPAPCALVSDSGANGFAVLKDRNGASQYLLIPTARITGVEDPALLAPGAANYFADAWAERGLVAQRLGRPLASTEISIAVNSVYGRSQDQLHLHIDCLDRTVGTALQARAIPHDGRWSTVHLKGRDYRVRWLDADALQAQDPFRLVAQQVGGARQDMAAVTIALTGAALADGRQGFYLLVDLADPARGDVGSAEELQDHDCRLGA